MTSEAESTIQSYHRHQSATVSGLSTTLGVESGWEAPVSIFSADDGFGEEAWVDEVPVTVLAVRLRGAPIQLCKAETTSGNELTPVLQPRGTPNHYFAKGPVRFAQIFLKDRFVDRVADAIRPGSAMSGSLRDDLVFARDRELNSRVTSYLAASQAALSLLELEASSIGLVSYLLRGFHSLAPPRPVAGGLSPWQLKRVRDAMGAMLDAEIGLDHLAGIAGCSPTHFSRAFKQSMGLAPFQYLLELRIGRAKSLIADSRLSLVDAASAVGFSAQPQFTTAFKRVTGVTPGAWRRAQL